MVQGWPLRVVPLGGAGAGEELRNLLQVEVLPDRAVGGSANRARGAKNIVAFDQLARLLDRLGRRVAVIVGDKGDLAAVHTALVVDHLEIIGNRDGKGAGVGERAAIRAGIADLDLAVADPGAVLFGTSRPGGQEGAAERESGGGGENCATRQALHEDLPFVSLR